MNSQFAGNILCQFGSGLRRMVSTSRLMMNVALTVEPNNIVVWLLRFCSVWFGGGDSCRCRSEMGAEPTYFHCRPVRRTWTQSCHQSLLLNRPQTFTPVCSPVFCSATSKKLASLFSPQLFFFHSPVFFVFVFCAFSSHCLQVKPFKYFILKLGLMKFTQVNHFIQTLSHHWRKLQIWWCSSASHPRWHDSPCICLKPVVPE